MTNLTRVFRRISQMAKALFRHSRFTTMDKARATLEEVETKITKALDD